MPRSGGLKPLQNTHEYTHKLIQTTEIRGLGREVTHTHGLYIHTGAEKNTRIHTRTCTYTLTRGSTETEKLQKMFTALWI